jgi:hypothetical protein
MTMLYQRSRNEIYIFIFIRLNENKIKNYVFFLNLLSCNLLLYCYHFICVFQYYHLKNIEQHKKI